MGLKSKDTHVESRAPNICHCRKTVNLERIGETRGLRFLKSKGLFAVFNRPLQAPRPSGEQAWIKQHKNHKYPFKFLRSSLYDGR